MNDLIKRRVTELALRYDEISIERKAILEKLSGYTSETILAHHAVNLLYVCTHNSRRSHFGQIAAQIAAKFYGIEHVKSFSAGTEITAINEHAINALVQLGCAIKRLDNSSNPVYTISTGSNTVTKCFSKIFSDDSIPKQNVIAIMTCTHAEQNCPFIPSAKYRISTAYEDPKQSDGSGREAEVYYARLSEILIENLYTFSLVKHQLNQK